MNETTLTQIENLHSNDKSAQNEAYYALMEATEQPVDWAYAVWDGLVRDLTDKDNHVRAIASQLLSNLAKSDPEKRILNDFEALLNVTYDERFVTARHCLQSIWKVGLAGDEQRALVMDGLEQRYHDSVDDKNTTLIRFDIIQDMRNLFDATGDETIHEKALELIEMEQDAKYRKKYAGVWKDLIPNR